MTEQKDGEATFATPQESFWAGQFGDEYTVRNRVSAAQRTRFFARVLPPSVRLDSALELGANVGTNLIALHQLFPGADLHGLEINPTAFEQLASLPFVTAHQGSLLDLQIERTFDLSMTVGVLIHVAPERLATAYDVLYEHSDRYILVAEYFNPTPVEITYRDHARRLFKRDFGGELLDRHPDLTVIDYGFAWRRDQLAMDDVTWFLFAKRSGA